MKMEALATYTQPFFAWLLETTLIASMVICLILAAQKLLGRRLGPRWCHALWLVLLLRMVLPWTPPSPVSLFNLVPASIQRHQPQANIPAVGPEERSGPVETSEATESKTVSTSGPAEATPRTAVPRSPRLAQADRPSAPVWPAIRRLLPLLWLAGALVLGGYLLVSNFALWRIVKREPPLINQQILELFETCKSQMGVQTIVALVPNDRVGTAALFGFVRPRLLLPREMIEATSPEDLRYVFLHELAHLKRHDIYLGWLASLLQVLHWFNPLVWYAFHRMRSDRELTCDALVLTRTRREESQRYGQTMVALLDRFSGSRRLPAMAGILESQSQMKRRITMIAQSERPAYKVTPLALILLVVLGCVSAPGPERDNSSRVSAPERSPGVTLTELQEGWGGFASISPDGKYMCDVDWDTEDLTVRELATGKTRPLTGAPSGEAGCPLESAISPDGSKVAYQWWDSATKTSSLYCVGLDGSGRRLLRRGGNPIPKGWSMDGQKILAVVSENDIQQMVWISASDGSIQHIASVSLGYPGKLDISPDGRFIAYDRPEAADVSERDLASRRDLFVFDLSENREVLLVKHPADDKLLGWTPDGRSIFFASDRTGTWAAWLLRVTDGKAQGFPELVKDGIGDIRAIGFAQGGSYYYHSQQTLWDICIASLNLETGEVLSEATPVRQTGATICHDWSPDGLYLAYCTQRANEPQVIYIRTLATGEERMLASDLPHFGNLRWSLDGQFVLVSRFDGDAPQIACKIDVQTGERTTLVSSETERLRLAELSRDGKSLFYIRDDPNTKTSRLVARDLENGREEDLFRAVPPVQGIISALSPDGQRFVLSTAERRPPSRVPVLQILPVAGGEPRELIRFDESEKLRAIGVTWMPDGRDVLFWKWFQGRKDLELWKISAAGGDPQKLWSRKSLGHLRVHPDGERVAFNDRSTKRGVWVIENFLPTTAVAGGSPRPGPAMTLRRIQPEEGDCANVSPDGKYLCDVDSDTGNLVIRELATGRRWPVTDKKSWEDSEEYAEDAAISPDSRRVAYLWWNDTPDSSSLYVVGLDGTGRRLLCPGKHLIPRDWSADGTKILGVLFEEPKQMVWVDAQDGSIQKIRDLGDAYPNKFDISPDGRFLAYDLPQAKDTKTRDVFLLDLLDNREIRLAEHPADDRLLGWTPNGKQILFASDRSDKWDAWLLGISDGKPAGLPLLVKANIGDVGGVGFRSNGDYYYSIYDLRENVYVAEFDLANGTLLSPPAPLLPTDKSELPVWSPDGQHLAYACSRGDKRPSIKIWSLASGQEREIALKVPPRLHFWAPDGKSLLLSGFLDEEWAHAVCSLDLQTGEYSALFRLRDMSIPAAQWFPDGKRILYHGRHAPIGGTEKLGYLMMRDVDSGEEREITRGVFPGLGDRFWALSPDGRQLAVQFKGDGSKIKIFSTETDEVREVLAGELAAKVHRIVWAPDGKTLLLRVLDLSVSRKSEIWRIAAEGGQPEKLSELDIPEYVTEMRIDPTGRHIALQAITNLHELWVIENFLPQEAGK
jgi:beta-lactamase regulating signal transducer with metallopeptidase domain/Tol biopolymer transport system component